MLKVDILTGMLTSEIKSKYPGIYDIDSRFSRIKVKNTDYNKRLVASIDKGILLDNGYFIDRFNVTLRTSCLSTGCKAGILVNEFPTQLVAVIECGGNALYQILKNCQEGHILMYDQLSGIPSDTLEDTAIDVLLNGFRFTSLNRLNHYFTEEIFMPNFSDVDLGLGGIEYVGV